jgi:sporulation protein YlmC with PRC-barrel domain
MSIFPGMLVLLWLSLALTTAPVAQQQDTPPGQTPPGAAVDQPSQGNQTGQHDLASRLSTLRGVLLSTEFLLGSNVRNLGGEEVGDIKQLMIDPLTGRVMYAVVSMGGFLGMGQKTVVVPWQTMEVVRDGNTLVFNVSQRLLQRAAGDEKAKVADPTERRQTEDTGAVPAPPGNEGSGGWGVETPYGQLYNPTTEQTINGQVVRVETGAPLPGMAPGMQILVKTDDAGDTRVHVGPEWYLGHQDVTLQENTHVQVTGALAEIEGQQVLLAREVQFDGHVLMLRDTQGMPMWSSLRRSP